MHNAATTITAQTNRRRPCPTVPREPRSATLPYVFSRLCLALLRVFTVASTLTVAGCEPIERNCNEPFGGPSSGRLLLSVEKHEVITTTGGARSTSVGPLAGLRVDAACAMRDRPLDQSVLGPGEQSLRFATYEEKTNEPRRFLLNLVFGNAPQRYHTVGPSLRAAGPPVTASLELRYFLGHGVTGRLRTQRPNTTINGIRLDDTNETERAKLDTFNERVTFERLTLYGRGADLNTHHVVTVSGGTGDWYF